MSTDSEPPATPPAPEARTYGGGLFEPLSWRDFRRLYDEMGKRFPGPVHHNTDTLNTLPEPDRERYRSIFSRERYGPSWLSARANVQTRADVARHAAHLAAQAERGKMEP